MTVTLKQWEQISKLSDQQTHLIKVFQRAMSLKKTGKEQVQALEMAISQITEGAKASRFSIDQKIALRTKDCLCLSAAMFNKVTLTRRKRTIRGMSNVKGAKGWLDTGGTLQRLVL